jgi:hypothetical protein
MPDFREALRSKAAQYRQAANRRYPPTQYLLDMATHYERLAAVDEAARGGSKPGSTDSRSPAVEKKLPPPKLG